MPPHGNLLKTTREKGWKRIEKDRSTRLLHLVLHSQPRFKDSHVLGLLRVTGNSQYQGLTLTCAHVGILLLGHGRWVGGAWTRALGQLYTTRGHHLT